MENARENAKKELEASEEAAQAKKPKDVDEEADDSEDENGEDDEGSSRESARSAAREEIAKRDREGAAIYDATADVSALPLRNIGVIMKRELRSYFDSVVAYIVLGVTMFAVGLWFFFIEEHGFWQVDRATMARMFEALPWLLGILVIPLFTMRSLAEEKRTGTIELLITLPIRDSEVILGKYFAALTMVLILFASTLLYPLAMFWWPWHLGPLDWGPIWTAYLGLVLYASAGTAIGLLYSCLTESQIIAFFLTAMTMAILEVFGLFVEALHGWQGDALAFVSFQSRFAPFGRGLIDTRAIIYFLSVTVLCLIVSFRSLESRKWS
jgi:ABC-2 type transport system permease protein